MLKEFKIILFVLGIGVSLFFINSDKVFAAYSFDESKLNLSWSNIPANAIYLDTNEDGIVDNIYTWAYGSGNFTLTKQYGNGLSSVTTNSSGTADGISFKLYGEEVWIASSVALGTDAWGTILNVITGEGGRIEGFVDGHSKIVRYHQTGLIKDEWGGMTIGIAGGDFAGAGGCHASRACSGYDIVNSTTLLVNSYCLFDDAAHNENILYSGSYIGGAISGTGCSDSDYIDNGHNVADNFEIAGNENGGWCTGTVCHVNDGGTKVNISPGFTFENIIISDSVQRYANGLQLPYGNGTIPNKLDLWNEYFVSDVSTDNLAIVNTHYKILDPTLASEVPFILIDDNGITKLVSLGATQKIALLPDYSNRAWDFVFLDDYTGSTSFSSILSSASLPTYSPYITDATTTYSSVSTQGAFVLPSGYYISPDGGATSRYIDAIYSNEKNINPSFLGLTTGLTSLSVEIQNAPSEYAVRISDSLVFDSEKYLWATNVLTADHSFTVDLPTGECVSITGLTLDEIAETTEYGTLCASGTMPKDLVYTQNLAFTFWSLPFGAAHEYNEPMTNLKTKVRADLAPFDYTVNVYHNNGTIFNSTTYSGVTTNATEFDLQNLNVTGADFPSRMEILTNGNIIYYATIGFPNYFSSTGAFFSQWFEVDGFNLLYMLPIIFAAMFTRNTVGLGTGMTVAFISILAWTGIIVIDEIIIYALIFIAIIGMLAYRQINR